MTKTFSARVGDQEVTVQALRVNGKAMTLQFFRQIERLNLLDKELQLDPLFRPWGHVRYETEGGNTWLVGELEARLVRTAITQRSLDTTPHRIEQAKRNARFQELENQYPQLFLG